MTQSMKAALVAFSIIVMLTIIKFVLYRVSGSIAVLSEAWHSFADIATTFLVLISIARQQHKVKNGAVPDSVETAEDEGTRKGFLKRIYIKFRSVNSELKISCLIGLVLFSVAASIIWRTIDYRFVEISVPLVTGIIFIILSFASFFLYRFEDNIGASESSAALKADSNHNRADMVISLLTGASLIVYYFGINLDRWVGLFIAVYILSFASELLVNSIRAIILKRQDVVIEYHFRSILWSLFKKSTYRSFFSYIEARSGIGHEVNKVIGTLPALLTRAWFWTTRLVSAALIVLYVSTAFYTIGPDEQGLLMRFGRLVNESEPVLPGLHLKYPFPVDEIVRYKTGKVHELTVGNRGVDESAMIWTKDHGDSRMFISADNTLFLPYVVIHYRIKDIFDYHLTFREGTPGRLLSSMAYQLLNRTFTTTSFYDLMIYKREMWIQSLKSDLQKEQDRLETGVEITGFCLRDMHPPIELAGAFDEVVAAGQLKEKYLNDAERRVNQVLSKERIQGMKTEADAQGYVTEKRSVAEGEARNYLLRYEGYQSGGGIMKDLLLLKSAEETLKGKKLFLVDPQSGIDERLLYIENYMFGRNRK